MKPVESWSRPVILGGGVLAIVLGLLNVTAQAASLGDRVESANEPATKATPEYPSDPEELLRLGNAAWDGKQWGEAARVYSRLLEVVPGHAVAAERSAEARRRADSLRSVPLDRETAKTYLEAGDWAKAVEWMAKVATVAPDDPWLVETLGERQAQVEQALASSSPLAAEPLCVGVSALPSGSGLRIACERRAGARASGEDAPPSGKVVRRIAQPKLLHRVAPRYPDSAEASRVAAVVIVEVEVDTRGHVRTARVLSGHPLFDRSALDAVKQWRYQPMVLNGVESGFRLTVPLIFNPR